jgi:DNA-binding MurR/RpiR family transcriptional regulator
MAVEDDGAGPAARPSAPDFLPESSVPGDIDPGADVSAALSQLIERGKISRNQQRIAHYLDRNPRIAAFESATVIAAHSGVSAASVVRFAQALGFRGWPALQQELRQAYLSGLMVRDLMADTPHSPASSRVAEAIGCDLRNLRTALHSVDTEQVGAIAQMIAGARRTLLVSSGTYVIAPIVIAHLGQIMGYDIRMASAGGNELMAQLAPLGKDDVVIGVSFWRVARHVTLALRSAQRHGIRTAAIADSVASPLVQGVEHYVTVPSESFSFFQSMTAALSVAYALVATLMDLGGAETQERILRVEELYDDLDILQKKMTRGTR